MGRCTIDSSVGAMREVPLESQGERSPSARGTEALQSWFCRPVRHSMTTGRRESYRSTCPREEKSEEKSRGKSEEKNREKNRGGDITPMRLRRSLFFVASATPAGTPCGASPARPSRPSPADPAGAGCGLPGAPRLPRPRRVRPVEPSCTGCAGAAGGRASAQAHRWRVLVANQVSEWPFSSPWVRKGRTTKNRLPDRRGVCNITDSHLTTAHYCAAKNIAPEQVSAHRPPFSVGLTTSAVRRGSSRLRAPSAAANAQ